MKKKFAVILLKKFSRICDAVFLLSFIVIMFGGGGASLPVLCTVTVVALVLSFVMELLAYLLEEETGNKAE